MSDELEKHVLKRFDIVSRLGKGASIECKEARDNGGGRAMQAARAVRLVVEQ